MGRVEDKWDEVSEFVEDLIEIVPESYDTYKSNLEKRLACERAFERIVEAVNDLAILVIKGKGLDLPSDDEKAFDILVSAGVIGEELALKMKEAKGMRNILAHRYGNIDDEIVFETISGEIVEDVRKLLELLK